MEGQLNKIYKDLCYGFIHSGGKSYFFHKEDYDGDWRGLCQKFDNAEDVTLEFTAKMTEKGPRASEVSYVQM